MPNTARKLPVMDATKPVVVHIKPADARRAESEPGKSALARALIHELGARSVEEKDGYEIAEFPAKVAAQFGTPPVSRGPVLVRFKAPENLADEIKPRRRQYRSKIGTPAHPWKGAHKRRLQYRFDTMERTHYNTCKRLLPVATLAAQIAATQGDLVDENAVKLGEYLKALTEAAETVESLLKEKNGAVELLPAGE